MDQGFTDKTMTRAGYENAIKARWAGDEFLGPAMDRFARNARDSLPIANELTELGVALNIGGVLYQPDSLMSRLFTTILAVVARQKASAMHDRTQRCWIRCLIGWRCGRLGT
ncbi:recombinase family protein [Rathayibacter soli]|uniref:recombinase family protein n=1 Tax=Rathayibacter soli TaxID=3144168 RepID=UPI00390805BD